MMEHEVARSLLTQEPGRANRHALAVGSPNIAQARKPRHKRAATMTIQIARLRMAFGLSDQQAALLAALAFGEGDKE